MRWTYQCGRTEFIEILKLWLSTSQAPKLTALEFQNFINFKQSNPDLIISWSLPVGTYAGGSHLLAGHYLWGECEEWIALFFWLSAQSCSLSNILSSCLTALLVSSPWGHLTVTAHSPGGQSSGSSSDASARELSITLSLHRDKRHKCNRSVRNPFWDNWDALCSSHAKSARSAKRIIQSLDSFTKSYKKTLFASGSHYSLNMHTVCFCQVSP